MRASLTAARLAVLLAVVALAAGCGSQLKDDDDAHASTGPVVASCPETVLGTLGSVLDRVYREGVHSERTASAVKMIERSVPLRSAIEAGDATAARAAAKELIATGHMTNLLVRSSSGRTLVALGGPALAPLRGTLQDAAGSTIATYVVSVWADRGFVSEGNGLAEGLVALRRGEHAVGSSLDLGPGRLAAQGTLTRRGVAYAYASLPVTEYPSGAPLTAYLLKTSHSIEPLCGASSEDTTVNTLSKIARGIYEAEGGPRTLTQVRRVQHDSALLNAVAANDPVATRQAIVTLLNQHIVRLRISGLHGLISDVGGPYVLQPVTAPLRLGGRRIGKLVLSIQDDEGYLRLARRLAGLKVLMYMHGSQLVKNSVGPGVGGPETVPASGRWSYRGQSYRVYTIAGEAFPSGPLTIRVLIPIPYS